MSNQALEQLIGYPPLTATECCMDKYQPTNELTDTEKAIYLKLVELAKAGKIEWTESNGGRFGDFRVTCDNTSTYLSKMVKEYPHTVAYIAHRSGQIAGDLYEIAQEQWKAHQAEMAAEFLQS